MLWLQSYMMHWSYGAVVVKWHIYIHHLMEFVACCNNNQNAASKNRIMLKLIHIQNMYAQNNSIKQMDFNILKIVETV